MSSSQRLWLARLLIGIVTLWNLQAALVFTLRPQVYAPSFMLTGLPGETAVRGVGVLFIMWNIPYLVALWHPRRYRLALGLALVMQLAGVIGESLILITIPAGYLVLHLSILRFIFFDGAGVLLLVAAYWLARKD
jgi:hypothetical protein